MNLFHCYKLLAETLIKYILKSSHEDSISTPDIGNGRLLFKFELTKINRSYHL